MNKRRSSSTSGDETDYFDRIPVDLFISNILSRLPVKSIAQCRCVSKLWSSLIRSPNYNLLFPIKSPAPPRILFTIEYERELFFYSSPQPHNPDENTSSLVATLHHRARGSLFHVRRPPLGGLVCRQDLRKNRSRVAVVSNPITGECLALPELIIDDEIKKKSCESYYFAYDPIKNQFKILSMITSLWNRQEFGQYQVLTLGTGNKNLLWRNIHCATAHYRSGSENMICINGVLYYTAVIYDDKGDHSFTMACFDVMSESFSFIDIDEDMSGKIISSISTLTLIDYKGRLGVCYCDIYNNLFSLWVLEDAQIHKWSNHIYQMPHSWLPEMTCVRAAGMIGSEVIALHPCYSVDPFFILYYNLKSNVITRVILEVPSLLSRCDRVHAFTNYVEDLKLM